MNASGPATLIQPVADAYVVAFASELRAIAEAGLPRMFCPDQATFAFRLRRDEPEPRLEGTSDRYTAIALIGLATSSPDVIGAALHGQAPEDVCARLIERVEHNPDMGAAALAHWAARVWDHPAADQVLNRLHAHDPVYGSHPTVQVAWALTAQSVVCEAPCDDALAQALAQRLLESFEPRSGLFPHWPRGCARSVLRAHVACFADLVYPVQALACFGLRYAHQAALDAARRCADRMCALQGPAGEWWWHYDVRTGRIIEHYPVYSVHQDSMGPMALLALRQAAGWSSEHESALWRGLDWLRNSGLVDTSRGIIWRKTARHEPNKLARTIQAGASRLHASLRVPGLNRLFPPGRVDWESRPYHLGWILHALTPMESAGDI